MPILRRETLGSRPEWVMVEDFEYIHVDPLGNASPTSIKVAGLADRCQVLYLVGGRALLRSSLGVQVLDAGSWITVPANGMTVSADTTNNPGEQVQLLRVAGMWKGTPHLGAFWARPGAGIEMHFHDFDEYWFIVHGRTSARVGDEEVVLSPGDLVATGAGVEHGMESPDEWVMGVGCKPPLRGDERSGHLHRGEDGTPVPFHD